MRNYRPWTEKDIAQLRAEHDTMPRAELARRMGRHPDYLAKKARALGLTKEPHRIGPALLEHIRAAGKQGIAIARLVELTESSARAVCRALTHALEAGQVHRHRYMNADLYYTSAEDCAANAERLRTERKAQSKALQQKYARNRYLAKQAALGRTPAKQKARPAATAARPTPKRAERRSTPAIDPRPGAQQVVTLPGMPAPVRVSGHRGPAHLPGDPVIPPGVKIQRGPAGLDTRYTASPDAYGLGLAKRRPGAYTAPPTAWVSAALIRHGA